MDMPDQHYVQYALYDAQDDVGELEGPITCEKHEGVTRWAAGEYRPPKAHRIDTIKTGELVRVRACMPHHIMCHAMCCRRADDRSYRGRRLC